MKNRFRTWLAVEIAATETLAEAGMVPKDAARPFASKPTSTSTASPRSKPKSDMTSSPLPRPSPKWSGRQSRWFHYGLTSNDVVDTAQALLIKQASAIIADRSGKLSEVLNGALGSSKTLP